MALEPTPLSAVAVTYSSSLLCALGSRGAAAPLHSSAVRVPRVSGLESQALSPQKMAMPWAWRQMQALGRGRERETAERDSRHPRRPTPMKTEVRPNNRPAPPWQEAGWTLRCTLVSAHPAGSCGPGTVTGVLLELEEAWLSSVWCVAYVWPYDET